MKVIKRNGTEVEFNSDKIFNAINKAADETELGIDYELAREIADNIEDEVEDLDFIPTVEHIQDMVEDYLMQSERRDIAKKYILYRDERNRLRNIKQSDNRLLTDEFISKYKHKPNPMGQLGSFVYYRTYSRWLPEEKRREYWYETVRRAVEYNCSLVPTTREEAEKLYDNIFHLRQFLSGRTLFTGGTEVSKKYGMSNFNCSYMTMDCLGKFKDLLYLLLIGAGVGIGVRKEDVAKLPQVRGDLKVIHKAYFPVPKRDRKEYTAIDFEDDFAEIIVGDSKEGWMQALDYFLKLFYLREFDKVQTIIINYDNIRPAGERLKTFGGYSSGSEPFMEMMDKVYRVLTKDNKGRKKLKPIDCMDIANIIGMAVVSGGVRRTSEVILFDYDDEEIAKAKSELYKQDENGNWSVDEEIAHRRMSNNSIQYTKKPSREQWHKHIQEMRYSGEPGLQNLQAVQKRKEDAEGGNPCFTGDMRLLTSEGYKTFEELNDTAVKVVNINGEITNGKVWYTGEKETIKLILSNKQEITCTPNHKFMTIDEKEVEAKDLKDIKIMPYTGNHKLFDDEYIKYGFIQGDGCLGRLISDDHKGLEVNIGEKDRDILFLFRNDEFTKNDKCIYLQGNYKDNLISLGFDSSQLPDRKFPSTYDEWTNLQKSSFLQGCYSANGSVITNCRVSYKTTSKEFAEKLVETLADDFNINAYITTNKAKEVEFNNGTYLCKESYDVNIGRYKDIQTFHNEINFYHIYKKIALRDLLIFKAPYVMNIKENGIKKVYDFNEPITHWGVVEGYIAHNCMEIILRDEQMCNLTEVNVMGFVENGRLNYKELYEAQKLSARAGYRMACIDFELHNWDLVNKEDMLIGTGLTGWQDMVNATNMTIEEEIKLLEKLREITDISADELADSLGRNRSKLKTTIKPSGSLSQLPVVSSGLHFSHSPYYIRRVRINANDPLVQVVKELEYPIHPEVGQTWDSCDTVVIEFPIKAPAGRTKYDVSAIEQLEIYKRFMKHFVQHNASITVHIRPHEWDEVEKWCYENWDDLIAVSFLSLDDSFYQLMPYESITKEEYEERASRMKPFNPNLLQKYEKEEVEIDLGESECTGGSCPIR